MSTNTGNKGGGNNGGIGAGSGGGHGGSGATGGGRDAGKVLGREARALPKRFYTQASVAARNNGFAVLLDGRAVKTPAKRDLAVPSQALAGAVAGEFAAQGAEIDPATMPLTRIVNSALDGVGPRRAEVAEDVVKYAGSDLLCYRADAPPGLVAQQARHWDPVLAWAARDLGARFVLAIGIMPVTQPETARAAIAAAVAPVDTLRLAAVHVMTTLTGSALLALAHQRGALDADATWAAAHVDEDWQIGQWGEDAEALARRAKRRLEFDAASRLLALL